MIEQLTDLPINAVGFRATGTVTKEEFDTILLPAVDKLANNTGNINYVFVLDTDVSNMTAGAWYDDLKMGLQHLLQWRKIAIVSDQEKVNNATAMAGPLMPGEVRAFTIAQLEDAKKWVAE